MVYLRVSKTEAFLYHFLANVFHHESNSKQQYIYSDDHLRIRNAAKHSWDKIKKKSHVGILMNLKIIINVVELRVRESEEKVAFTSLKPILFSCLPYLFIISEFEKIISFCLFFLQLSRNCISCTFRHSFWPFSQNTIFATKSKTSKVYEFREYLLSI